MTALVSDSFGTSEDQVEVLAGQSNLRSCWRLPLHVHDVPCDLAHIKCRITPTCVSPRNCVARVGQHSGANVGVLRLIVGCGSQQDRC